MRDPQDTTNIEHYLSALPPIDDELFKSPIDELSARQIGETLRAINPGLYGAIRQNMKASVYDIESSRMMPPSHGENVIGLTPLQIRGIIALSALSGAAVAALVIGKSLQEAAELDQQVLGQSNEE